MAGFINKFLDYIGYEESELEEDYREDYYEEEESEQNDNVVSFSSRDRRRAGNVVDMHAASHMKMIVYHPISYEDTRSIIDNLKSRKPVVVNMEDLEVPCAQRVLDFIAGAIYALGGTTYKITRGIYIVAPNNYDVLGNGGSDYDDDGLI